MTIEIIHHNGLLDYEEATRFMDERVAKIHAGEADECLWFVEHPPLYTAGTSAKDSDLLDTRFPVYQAGRGGEYTYHGPKQRVVYAMLDLKKRHDQKPDLKKYVWQLEQWIIQSLAEFGVAGGRREGRVGIWVVENDDNVKASKQASTAMSPRSGVSLQIQENLQETVKKEAKISAIGIRVRKWITFHGIAINLNPDLSHFSGIVPCGIKEHGVTSLHNEGVEVSMENLDAALQKNFADIF